MSHAYGRPPGPVNDQQPFSILDIPGGLTLATVAAGAVDLNDMGSGDSLDTLTVDGTNIMTAAITYATSLAVTARLVAININANSQTSGYWARIKPGATDWIQIFRNNGGSTAATVSGTDTGFTPAYVDVGTEIAAVAAARVPSWNYGIDFFADTNVYKMAFDFSLMPSAVQSYKAVDMVIYPEDQVVYAHIGPEGVIYCPSAKETTISVKGAMDGDVSMFLSAAAATNCAFRFKGF